MPGAPLIEQVRDLMGGYSAIARALAFDVSPQAVRYWVAKGSLPKTELFVLGGTRYAEVLAQTCTTLGRPDITAVALLAEIPGANGKPVGDGKAALKIVPPAAPQASAADRARTWARRHVG